MKRQPILLVLLLALQLVPSFLRAQALSGPATVLEDFEDASRDLTTPHRTNLWGGVWNTVGTGGSSLSVSFTAKGQDSSRALGAKGYTNGPGDWAILQSPLTDWKVPYNATCHGLVGFQFWLKGDGKRYRIEAMSRAVTDNNYYGDTVHSSDDDWKFFQVPFADMTRSSGWGSQSDLPQNPDGTEVTGFQIFPLDKGEFAYCLDQVSFYGNYVPVCAGTPVALQQVAAAPTPVPRKPRDEASDTPTPGGGLRPTYTPIHNYCPPKLLDDFEDPARNGAPPSRTNLWGGGWTSSITGGNITVAYGGPGASGTASGVSGSGRWSGTEGSAVIRTTLNPDGSPYDLLEKGFNAVQFYLKGDGNSYWINILSAGIPDQNGYSYQVTPPKGEWTLFRVPFKNMNRRDWWETKGGVSVFPDGSDITAVEFKSQNSGSFAFGVDEIAFYCDSAIPLPPHPPKRLPTKTPVPPPPPTFTRTVTPVPTRREEPPTQTRTSTSTFMPPKPIATSTRVPRALLPTPAWVKPVPIPTLAWRPTPTLWRPVRTWTPLPQRRLPTPNSTLLTSHFPPTQVPTWFPPLDTSQAVTFLAPPANIYMVFADGTGLYQLKVVDGRGTFVQTIFDQRVVGQKDAWVYWDGKDGEGKDMSPGQYFMLLFKDGKALKRISVIRAGP